MTTVGNIVEAVRRTLSNPIYSVDDNLTYDYVLRMVQQAANEVLAIKAMQPTRIGHVDIPACAQVTVTTNVETDSYGNTVAYLSYLPLELPMGLGVFRVVASNDPFRPFLPLPAGYGYAMQQITHNRMRAVLDKHICYERWGNHIVFNKPASEIGDTVRITLLGMKPDFTTKNNPIPISVDLENEIVRRAVQMIAAVPPADERGDFIDNPGASSPTQR